MLSNDTTNGTRADGAMGVAEAVYTWGDLLPLPVGEKFPPPSGFTGEHGRTPTDVDRAAWAGHVGNWALRVPSGVVGLDVDHYGTKRGLDTIAAVEAELGPLPATWTSTGRDIGTGSGIRFYRYGGGKLASVVGASVEVIQRGHRYAVVWPSTVEGRAYRWYRPDATEADRPPALGELAELPEAWAAWLKAGAAASAGASAPDGARDALLARLLADHRPPCGPMGDALARALERLQAAGDGGRHDAATAGVLAVVGTGAEGHTGAGHALAELEAAFGAAVGLDPARTGEFQRMVATAAAKAATEHPAALPDPCDWFGLTPPAPASSAGVVGVEAPGGGLFQPVNLDAYADGTHTPTPATLLQRTDGHGLLYPGNTHAFNGEPESGKSLLAQWAVAVELSNGNPVLVLDYESDAAAYVARVRAMGVTAEHIKAGLVYVNPDACPVRNPAARAALAALASSRPFTLAVFDGLNEALALGTLNANDAGDVTAWHRNAARLVAGTGPAVVVVDHVTKSSEGRGRFAIGSQAKLSAISGAAYLIDVKRPLAPGLVGELVVKVAKDRPGGVRALTGGQFSRSTRLGDVARVVIDSQIPGRIVVAVTPPPVLTDDDGEFRPTGYMERVSRALELTDEPMSFNKLAEAVGGKREHVQAAVAALIKEGHVTTAPGARKATLHTSAAPYREADDPRRDRTNEANPPVKAGNQSGPETPVSDASCATGTGSPIEGGTPGTSQGNTLTDTREPVGTSGEPVTTTPANAGENATDDPRAGSLGWRPPTMPTNAPTAAARQRKTAKETTK